MCPLPFYISCTSLYVYLYSSMKMLKQVSKNYIETAGLGGWRYSRSHPEHPCRLHPGANRTPETGAWVLPAPHTLDWLLTLGKHPAP